MRSTAISRHSMKLWSLEEFGAVGRSHRYIEGVALTIERERHVDPGSAERPQFFIKLHLAHDLFAPPRQDQVAGLSSARAAGPLGAMPATTTLSSISVENTPSQGRAGLLL